VYTTYFFARKIIVQKRGRDHPRCSRTIVHPLPATLRDLPSLPCIHAGAGEARIPKIARCSGALGCDKAQRLASNLRYRVPGMQPPQHDWVPSAAKLEKRPDARVQAGSNIMAIWELFAYFPRSLTQTVFLWLRDPAESIMTRFLAFQTALLGLCATCE
jgi:hypothetical protein